MRKNFISLALIILAGICLFPAYGQTAPAVPTPTPTVTPVFPACADVNQDNKVDVIDALMIAQCYVSIGGCACEWGPCPDVDCDGDIDIVDALRIAQYYVGLITSLCCS